MSEVEVFNRRIIPQNNLEVDMLVTNPAWGTDDINPELKERLKKLVISKGLKDDKGEILDVETRSDLWSLLSIFTRDLRLANLSGNDIHYCKYYLDLAHDELQQGFLEPFTISMSRVAGTTELSQSRGGFLRKLMRTFTGEHININEEKKKSFMNKNKGD